MSRRPMYRMCFGGLIYQFESKTQLFDWVDSNIAYSADRRQLYEALMCDAYNYILRMVEEKTPEGEAESIAILKSLKTISEKYGPTYDPDQEVFKVEEDIFKKLEIE